MTHEQFNALEANLKTAKSAGDQRLIDEATQEFVRETAHCQMKMSGRVKEILSDTGEIKDGLKTLADKLERDAETLRQKHEYDVEELRKEAVQREDIRCAKKSGARSMLEVLKAIASAGGGMIVLKFLETL